MQIKIPHWRAIRMNVLLTLKIKPKRFPESSTIRATRALNSVHATPAQKEQALRIVQAVQERANAKQAFGSNGKIEEDAHVLALERETERILGKKRATKFFRRANDPYF